ncbi:Uma2 family endonuclease [Streptomyces sp. NPDC001251]
MSVAYELHTGPWTVADVLDLPEDTRNRIELVGGSLMMSPAPGVPHQRASRRLSGLLEQAVVLAGAPLEVLEAVNVVVPDGLLIPDLALVDAAAAAEAELTVNAHDVLAVVEIASPSTRVTDQKVKPALYAGAGIAHYWRVELKPVPRIHFGVLRGTGYVDQALAQVGQPTRIEMPFPFEIDPAQLAARSA